MTPQLKTILYAEDDMVVLTVHRMRLQKAGYHVIAAHDGLEAIKKLSTFVPDLMLLDLMLPRFNGEEVLKFMQSNPSLMDVPVIILSTNSIRDAMQEPLLERASKRLIKGNCNSAMLLEAIHDVLGTSPAEIKSDRPALETSSSFSDAFTSVAA
jgi:CheY-like chemotaxis protein